MRSLSADWLPDGTMLVLSEAGIIYRVDPATGAQSVELDITSKVFSESESGALDLLVDPAGTGFYIYYTVAGSDRLRVSHFTLGSAAEAVVWENPGLGYNASRAVHLGGSLAIGPDGKMYLTVGDRYEGRSQDLTNVFGKVLRFNLDGTVPTDNPFYDGAGPNADEIWAYGFRNPYRASFDEVTGRLWVGDVGGNVDTSAYEEVNLVERGGNYGWPACEGPLVAAAGSSLTATYTDTGSCASVGTLMVSGASSRADAVPLEGVTLAREGPAYIFFEFGKRPAKVEFWLDAPVTSPPTHVESGAPYDFAGGTTAAANPWSPGSVAPGPHTVTTRVTKTDGTTETFTMTFVVGST